MLHPSQVIVRIREIYGFLEDIELDHVYDYSLENGVIEFQMKPEIGDHMFVISEITSLENVMKLVDDLQECYEEMIEE